MDNMQDKARNAAENTSNKVANAIDNAKQAMPDVTPNPPGFKSQSSVHDLKSRLEWGEPALTILDVRDREAFNQGHITGAMSMPMDQLVDRANSSLERTRDIYVYGDTDDQSAQAASSLRGAGFQCVAELKGGLPAWKAAAGPTDGIAESQNPPGPEGYNVVSQMAHHAETQKMNLQ